MGKITFFSKEAASFKQRLGRWALVVTMAGMVIAGLGSILSGLAFFVPEPPPKRKKSLPRDEKDSSEESEVMPKEGTHNET